MREGGEGERERGSYRARGKNIDDRFRVLTQISPQGFRIVDAAAAASERSSWTDSLPGKRILNRRRGSLIRVLIWLPIKPNIPAGP